MYVQWEGRYVNVGPRETCHSIQKLNQAPCTSCQQNIPHQTIPTFYKDGSTSEHTHIYEGVYDKSTPPPQTEVEIPPSPRVTFMDTPSPRVHNAILNLITIPDRKNTNEDEPIVSHKRNFTQTPTPPLPTAPTNGLS